MIVACDNNDAIQRVIKGDVKTQEKHFDYLSGIAGLLADLQITINFSHMSTDTKIGIIP